MYRQKFVTICCHHPKTLNQRSLFFALHRNRLETALHESGVQKTFLVFDSNRDSQPLVHETSPLGYAP